MKKTILVTGGAGFIGSHLIEELVKDKNNKVISLDNYFTGKKENHIEGAEYIEGETKDVETLITEIPDIVYHLGEYSRVLTSFDDVDLVWRLNKEGTFKVLEFCRKNNVRLVYAGSSTKFGEFDDAEDGENQSPYAYFKATNTNLVNNYGNWFGLDYAITYFYNVYGEREIKEGKYATLIGIFGRKFKNNEKLTVVSPGTQKRAFTYVGDIVNGLILVGEKGKGDGHCIGSEENYSILEIANIFGGEIEMLPAKKGDRNFSKIDLTKMRELGWSAESSIKNYIEKIKNQ
ncbi:TPA: ADP-L-glycero-D-manno-heptose-6-epimerase [Candidatus Campbellbacteria bacterium]|nr:MAG: NAD-dependent epimerase/dehydratase, UDP-glucose 4-epimerase [Candidatus Campbellbacteria bacterium GW2011_OD1_34_28]KKP75435.1 MAG: Polysaccharide biosynthesis protein [Candidatus Campbellbacteria bacterium GW2011_GWD2_35_24]KKP76004.1 MAG: NAD-dependent epimerase/dehydratase, UDP-glucose 4-epimerase [Candidatus Campbellbacteria bacterium GW2011_GWC2_35_28]KKP77193.1 MAG: Polysaccharide biosynthesis protein [Candidatus Campbellbacteria bacterium GW2011_GWC1_35_31]KKP79122.1 MAG: Polysa